MKKYSGKNLDDVLSNVAREKGVNVEDLTYFVTEEKAGFLGFGSSVTAEVYALSDVREFLKDYLVRFFTTLEIEVEVDVQQEKDTFQIMLNAENNAILIGKNGQTLTAMNTVVRSAVNSAFRRRFNVLIDINNYKVDRYDKVKMIAARVARTVQRTKISATLDPMPNDERKVVHQYLGEMKNIRTESEGEGINRRLRIHFDRNKNNDK
jgi:spoIIIJ-associated protein